MKNIDGQGNALVDDAEYYIQDRRQFVGNCILWWGIDSQGYTCNLDQAGVYTGAFCRGRRDTDIPWPKAYVDAHTVRHARGDAAAFEKWERVK